MHFVVSYISNVILYIFEFSGVWWLMWNASQAYQVKQNSVTENFREIKTTTKRKQKQTHSYTHFGYRRVDGVVFVIAIITAGFLAPVLSVCINKFSSNRSGWRQSEDWRAMKKNTWKNIPIQRTNTSSRKCVSNTKWLCVTKNNKPKKRLLEDYKALPISPRTLYTLIKWGGGTVEKQLKKQHHPSTKPTYTHTYTYERKNKLSKKSQKKLFATKAKKTTKTYAKQEKNRGKF